ncbi:MAG: helix-turn-helix transcriptional regulator [Myxococcales bacterium]|nr:helix-turn-helix transcriptional regulator [Myxococcales bacterium]
MNALSPVKYHTLGSLIRTLRRASGFTQEALAQRSNLSPDSIRRLEGNAFSPSLITLKKLCDGLGMRLSTLFALHEGGKISPTWELEDMLTGRTPEEIRFVTDAVKELLAGLGRMQDASSQLPSSILAANEH